MDDIDAQLKGTLGNRDKFMDRKFVRRIGRIDGGISTVKKGLNEARAQLLELTPKVTPERVKIVKVPSWAKKYPTVQEQLKA